MAIGYKAERITADAAQLANWHGMASATTMNLNGPCPKCGDKSAVEIPRRISALEGAHSQPSKTLTIDVTCACEGSHPGRPDDVSRGCGRAWSVVSTAAVDGTVTLALAPPEPALVRAAEALRTEAAPKQLAALRGAADRWTGGVTAIFSLFGLAGITIARNTIAGLGTGWQVLIAIAAVLSIVLAGLAIYLIYRAAYGWPETYPVTDDAELLKWYEAQQAAPRVQAQFFTNGVRAAGGALAMLIAAVGLLWFAPQEPAAIPMVRVTLTDGTQVCGTLLPATPKGTLIRQASDGTAIDIQPRSITALTVVKAC